MDYSTYSYLQIDVADGIAVVTINRPERLNACRLQDHQEVPRLLRQLQLDDDVRAVVIRGAGKAFSVGGDLELLGQVLDDDRLLVNLMIEARGLIEGHLALEKPTIAAIHGYAMGAGLAFALLCDFTYAERGTQLADGHIRGAVAAGDGGALIWPLTVGMAKAKRYLMTGDWVSAEEAERIGLITEVVEPGTSFDHAMAMARRLAEGPALAIRYTKLALNQWLRLGVTTAFDYSAALETLTFRSEECKATIRGLIEAQNKKQSSSA